MNEVCTFTHSMTPNQISAASAPTTGVSSFCATGASSGTMMKTISKKSRKKARKNTNRLTTIRKPQTPPGRPVIRCSTHGSPSTPWKMIEKQVEPIRMKITIAVMRMVAWKACTISSRSSRNCQARQHSQTIAANMTVKATLKGIDLKAVDADQRADDGGGATRAEHDAVELAERRVAHHGQHDGADGAHGARLGRRRQAHHDGAEHQEDQHGRRDDAPGALDHRAQPNSVRGTGGTGSRGLHQGEVGSV